MIWCLCQVADFKTAVVESGGTLQQGRYIPKGISSWLLTWIIYKCYALPCLAYVWGLGVFFRQRCHVERQLQLHTNSYYLIINKTTKTCLLPLYSLNKHAILHGTIQCSLQQLGLAILSYKLLKKSVKCNPLASVWKLHVEMFAVCPNK